MKRVLAGTLSAGLLMGVFPHGRVDARQQPGPFLTLRDAIGEALANGSRTLRAEDDVEAARLDVAQANAAFLPQVTPALNGAIGNKDLANQSVGVDVLQRLPTGAQVRGVMRSTSSRNQLGTYYFGETSVLVSQPLLQGWAGRWVRSELDGARWRLHSEQQRKARVEQQVALETAEAYYAIVSREGRVKVATKAMERARRLVAQSTARMRIGLVSQIEVLRAEQLLAQAEAEHLDVQAALQTAQDRLRLLLAWPPERAMTVASAIDVGPDPPAMDEAVEMAFRKRLDLQAADGQVSEAERQVELAATRARPQVDVQLAMTKQATGGDPWASLSGGPFRFSTFVTSAVPLNRAEVNLSKTRAALQVRAQERERDDLRRQVAAEVRQAVREQARALQALSLSNRSSSLAASEADVARFRFERGLSSNLDLVTAEVGLLAAEQQEVEARAAVALARMRVLAAMGALDPRADAF